MNERTSKSAKLEIQDETILTYTLPDCRNMSDLNEILKLLTFHACPIFNNCSNTDNLNLFLIKLFLITLTLLQDISIFQSIHVKQKTLHWYCRIDIVALFFIVDLRTIIIAVTTAQWDTLGY